MLIYGCHHKHRIQSAALFHKLHMIYRLRLHYFYFPSPVGSLALLYFFTILSASLPRDVIFECSLKVYNLQFISSYPMNILAWKPRQLPYPQSWSGTPLLVTDYALAKTWQVSLIVGVCFMQGWAEEERWCHHTRYLSIVELNLFATKWPWSVVELSSCMDVALCFSMHQLKHIP